MEWVCGWLVGLPAQPAAARRVHGTWCRGRQALKEVPARQIEEMKAAGLTMTAVSRRMSTGRAQLAPANTPVTLHTPQKAASVVGRRLRLELV